MKPKETLSDRSRWVRRDYLYATAILVAGALWGFISVRNAADMETLLAEARREATQKTVEKTALLRGIRSQLPDTAWLRGHVAGESGRVMRIGMEYHGLLYGISVDCAHCVTNLPALRVLHEAGVTIVAVGVATDYESATQWSLDNDVPFPVLGAPDGPLLPIFEHAGYPFSVFVYDGRLTFGVLGEISELQMEQLRRLGPD